MTTPTVTHPGRPRTRTRYPSPLQQALADAVTTSLTTTGTTQRALAATAHISEHHLSQILTGERGGSLNVWDAVLTAAGVTTITLGHHP